MKRSYILGFSIIEISYWCFYTVFGGFISSYLLENGFTPSLLSLMNAAYFICAFAGSFVFGSLCDRLRSNRLIFIIGTLLTALLASALFFKIQSPWLMMLLYPLYGFVFLPLASIIDAWILRFCQNDLRVYGFIRTMPSVVGAFVSAIFGRLILNHGYFYMLSGGLLFLFFSLIPTAFIPDVQPEKKGEKIRISRSDLKKLLANPPYYKLLLILFFLGCATIPLNNLRAVIIENVGGSVDDLGFHSFVGSMTQIPFILFSGKILKIPRRHRYFFMCGSTLLSLFSALTADSMTLLYVSVFFSNASYGTLLTTMRETTENSVDKNFKTLGHSLSEAVYTSFSGAVCLTYSGMIAEYFEISVMLELCIFLCLIPCVVSFLEPASKECKV